MMDSDNKLYCQTCIEKKYITNQKVHPPSISFCPDA